MKEEIKGRTSSTFAFLKSLCWASIKLPCVGILWLSTCSTKFHADDVPVCKTAPSEGERCNSVDCFMGEKRKRDKGTQGVKEWKTRDEGWKYEMITR
jgi:hypothetical protein